MQLLKFMNSEQACQSQVNTCKGQDLDHRQYVADRSIAGSNLSGASYLYFSKPKMWCKMDDTVCSVTELAFPGVALGDAQNDSMESLNFGKN